MFPLSDCNGTIYKEKMWRRKRKAKWMVEMEEGKDGEVDDGERRGTQRRKKNKYKKKR